MPRPSPLMPAPQRADRRGERAAARTLGSAGLTPLNALHNGALTRKNELSHAVRSPCLDRGEPQVRLIASHLLWRKT